MMIFVTKTACWISKLLNCTIEHGKSLTQVSSVTCLMRPWRFTIFNYRRSECLWLDKRTSSTLELLNFESFHFSLRREYDKQTISKTDLLLSIKRITVYCSRPESSTTISYNQATSKGYLVKKTLKLIKLWTNLRHSRYIHH